jgi:hypothetical protein
MEVVVVKAAAACRKSGEVSALSRNWWQRSPPYRNGSSDAPGRQAVADGRMGGSMGVENGAPLTGSTYTTTIKPANTYAKN